MLIIYNVRPIGPICALIIWSVIRSSCIFSFPDRTATISYNLIVDKKLMDERRRKK